MNEYSSDNLLNRLSDAEEAVIHPLKMLAKCTNDIEVEALAINEVSLIRAGAQAAKLQISVDGRIRLPELVCDGALLSTPAGSTAYNYSAHGPILPIGAEILAMTAMSAFRPRRWRGALLPESAHVRIDVLESEKRPVTASADSKKAYDILSVDIFSAPDHKHRILFDPGHGLEERLLREQFV
jgi:NAD+ kinase